MSDDVLNGMQAIAEHMGKSRTTIHRWIHELGMPAINEGPGRGKKVMTTKLAITMWVLAISKGADKYPKGGLPKL